MVAAAGTLGALIPPSVAMVIYGWFAQQPIGQLLMAGVLPGLLTAGAYALMIMARAYRNPSLAPPMKEKPSREEKVSALLEVWPIPVLILGVIGGIYSGFTTPTEAGAFGAFLTACIALVKRQMTLTIFWTSVLDAAKTTAAIFAIGVAAILFTRFLAFAGIQEIMVDTVSAYGVGPIEIILVAMVIYIILGMFLDPLGLMLLTLPIFIPVFNEAGVNMIWAGVLIVKFIEIGFITPPVGMNAFVIKGIVGKTVPLSTIFRGLTWFIAVEIVVTGLLIAFPAISLFLPSLMQ